MATAGVGEQRRDARFECRVQLVDDLVLVAEMVVEIAGTDVQLVGDVGGRDVRNPVTIEQREARLEDPFAGAAGSLSLRHGRQRGGRRGMRRV